MAAQPRAQTAASPISLSPYDAVHAIPLEFAPFYCEENVYKLIEFFTITSLSRASSSQLASLFILSRTGCSPVWHQKVGTGREHLALWDYHVVALEQRVDGTLWVWDVDSTLPCPCPWNVYCELALRPGRLPVDLERAFRVVTEPVLRSSFASDRSHMRGADGTLSAPPPPWPCIRALQGQRHTLPRFLDPDVVLGPGTILLEEAELTRLPARLCAATATPASRKHSPSADSPGPRRARAVHRLSML